MGPLGLLGPLRADSGMDSEATWVPWDPWDQGPGRGTLGTRAWDPWDQGPGPLGPGPGTKGPGPGPGTKGPGPGPGTKGPGPRDRDQGTGPTRMCGATYKLAWDI